MNVLIVDDDRFVVHALKERIDWAALAVEHVYTAYNIRQAKQIIEEKNVDVLLSDIEMPKGSGLDLLAWLRAGGYTPQTVFLTNHADFHYAQKAIALQSFDYFLKPIEFDKLTLILKKAIDTARTQQVQAQMLRAGRGEGGSDGPGAFWRGYLAAKADVPVPPGLYAPGDRFLPILLRLFRYAPQLGENVREQEEADPALVHTLGDILTHCLSDKEMTLEAFQTDEAGSLRFLCVLRISEPADARNAACAYGRQVIHQVNTRLKYAARCDVGVCSMLGELRAVLLRLYEMSAQWVGCRNRVFFQNQYSLAVQYEAADLARLERRLQENDAEGFIRQCVQYLECISPLGGIPRESLHYFREDVIQVVYTFLRQHEILAHRLQQGKAAERMLAHSMDSIEDMMQYLHQLVHTSLDYKRFADSKKSVMDVVCEIIDRHYHEDISRQSIADQVYLSPDHLARIFKREMGVSLGAYIVGKRIQEAKRLLMETGMSVSAVSDKVGYGNYSHFIKLFKRETGYTPLEYRRICLSKKSEVL